MKHNLAGMGLYAALWLAPVGAYSADSAVAIQHRALAARRAIKSFIVEIESHSRERDAVIDDSYTVYLDAAKRRADRVVRYGTRPAEAPSDHYTEVSCFGCYDEDMHVGYSDIILADGGRLVVTVADPEHVNGGWLSYVPEPRWIGLIPMDIGTMRSFHIDYVLGSPGSEAATIVAEEYDGCDCQRVEFVMPSGAAVRLWIAASRDYSVLRNEAEFDAYGVHYLDAVKVSVAKDQKSGLWFPDTARYERQETTGGNTRTTREEALTLRVRQLNEPVDPAVFSVKGIGILKPGTTLHWVSTRPPPASGQAEWDGERFSPVAARSPLAAANPGTVRRLIYLNVAIIAAIVSLVLLRKCLSARRGAKAGA